MQAHLRERRVEPGWKANEQSVTIMLNITLITHFIVLFFSLYFCGIMATQRFKEIIIF